MDLAHEKKINRSREPLKTKYKDGDVITTVYEVKDIPTEEIESIGIVQVKI